MVSRKNNPSYRAVRRKNKNGKMQTVYVLKKKRTKRTPVRKTRTVRRTRTTAPVRRGPVVSAQFRDLVSERNDNVFQNARRSNYVPDAPQAPHLTLKNLPHVSDAQASKMSFNQLKARMEKDDDKILSIYHSLPESMKPSFDKVMQEHDAKQERQLKAKQGWLWNS